MPDGADRREARRFLMSLPMRVLPREAHKKELHANTRDVSYRGHALYGPARGVSMVFQSFALFPWLTVQQNVEIGLEARGIAPAERARRAGISSPLGNASKTLVKSAFSGQLGQIMLRRHACRIPAGAHDTATTRFNCRVCD